LQLLRKRYVSASNANLSSPASLVQVARVRGDIIEVLNEWLRSGGGSQDLLDDSALYLAIKAFLESSSDHEVPESQHKDDAEVTESWAGLKSRISNVAALFTSQTLRPSIPATPARDRKKASSGVLVLADLLDLDSVTPEDLVNDLNAMASAAFRNITEDVSCLIT
jgi:hypothetical protein